MGLIFRNRQVAGNICLVVFLAFMFTLLPGQLWTTNAYAAETFAANTIVSNSVDHNLVGTKLTISIDPVSDITFASTIQVLINKINSTVNNLVYKVTYDKIGNMVYSVYLWVYGVNSGTVGDLTYQWVYDNTPGHVKSVSVGKVWVPPATPVTPAAPAVTRDDTANTVAGMAVGMEYNLDGAGYVVYNATTFNAINFAGNHTLLVRIAAEGINPVSADTTLTFTTNPVTHDHNNNPATPATPAVPAIPGVTPATPAVPATPAHVVAEITTNKPTVAQTKQLEVINVALGKLPVPSASNRVITVGKSKVFIPELVITSSKVVVIMPLTSTTLDAKAVNYKIAVVKAYLAAQGIKNVPVRFVFLNTNPKLKVSVKAGSYFQVATPTTLVKAISSTVANKAVVANKANVMKAFGIKVLKK